MNSSSHTTRQRRVKICATIVFMVGLFQLCLLPLIESSISPVLIADALHFELEGLDCKEEAIHRIVTWKQETLNGRIVISIMSGAALIVVSGVLFLNVFSSTHLEQTNEAVN